MNIKIVIAAHKNYQMPADDIYLPVQVGAKGKADIGYTRDDSGDNISEKNPYYCELTGMYWAWKNLDADYYGLVHYRRHFSVKKPVNQKDNMFPYVLTSKEARELVEKHDIIVPKKRNYYIESLYSHYAHTHYGEHLDETRKILSENCPEYVGSFDKVMKKTSAHMFNMMIMKKEYFMEYCNWLFPILEELGKRINYQEYDAFQARFFGRVSELLLDVWLDARKYNYFEIPTINMEKLNWKRKIISFLTAKFSGKKYNKSF